MWFFVCQVLDAVLKQINGKDNCFIRSEEAFCGNRIVEGNEQCDCGFANDCNNALHPDKCCYPQEAGPQKCQRYLNATCRLVFVLWLQFQRLRGIFHFHHVRNWGRARYGSSCSCVPPPDSGPVLVTFSLLNFFEII